MRWFALLWLVIFVICICLMLLPIKTTSSAEEDEFFYLTQPNGRKIVFAPISIVAFWRPPEGVCRGETQVITGPMSFGTPFTVLVALTLFGVVLGPFAAAAALRHGLD